MHYTKIITGITVNIRYHFGLSEGDDMKGVKNKKRNIQIGLGHILINLKIKKPVNHRNTVSALKLLE